MNTGEEIFLTKQALINNETIQNMNPSEIGETVQNSLDDGLPPDEAQEAMSKNLYIESYVEQIINEAPLNIGTSITLQEIKDTINQM